jgi:hypothetical protein
MNAAEYIKEKQVQWALNRGIALQGSKGDHGEKIYTLTRKNNLFRDILPEIEADFNNGDGGELKAGMGGPPKINALHSSAALAVNIFQYWIEANQPTNIAAACGLCNKENRWPRTISFEKKFPICDKFNHAPNIDVVIQNAGDSEFNLFAIESKFTEPFSSYKKLGLKDKYFNPAIDEIWEGLPNLKKFTQTIRNKTSGFKHFDAAQLVKHILGLKNCTENNGKFKLLYLYYDGYGSEGALHREEIQRFIDETNKDGIHFHALCYQELIVRLAREYCMAHSEYIEYITVRYL